MVTDLSGDEFTSAIIAYENINEIIVKIATFAHLLYAADMAASGVSHFRQKIIEQLTDISSNLIFFTLEINQIDDQIFQQKLSISAINKYKPWLDNIRLFRPHQLSTELERFIHDRSVVGPSAWVRLYQETHAGLRFDIDGQSLPITQTSNLLSNPNREVRAKAAKALSLVFSQNANIFAMIYNNIIKQKEINDRWRKYQSPTANRDLANNIEPEVVEALITAVRSAYPRLSHRYYKMKAKWLSLEQMEHWDRNAPLPSVPERKVEWQSAKKLLLILTVNSHQKWQKLVIYFLIIIG